MKKNDIKNLKKSNGFPCPGPGCNGEREKMCKLKMENLLKQNK
jgi:hypothetical protein